MILVDTSVWIEFLKGTGSKYQSILHQLIADGEDIGVTGINVTEILQGIGPDKSYRAVKKDLANLQVFLPEKKETFNKAAAIYRECRKKGKTLKGSISCLISAIAIKNNLALFHKDKDFDVIAEVTGELRIYKV